MKRLVILAALLLGLVLGGGPVSAAPPEEPPGKPGVIFDIPSLEGVCEFPIRLLLTGKGKEIDLPGDRTILPAPGQQVTITNNLTGESVSYVITGATHQQTLANGNVVSTVTGRNVVLNFANSDRQGVFLLVGTFSFELDALGDEVEVFSGIGQVTDVCELLAE